jgi:O-antigen/teichoic acid export membrane protein
MLSRLNLKSEFLKYIFVLMSGTAMAQVLGYVFAPIITRLYTPEEGAELGLYIRFIGVGAAMATLRYELAIPIPKNDVHSFRLYRVALATTLIVTVICFAILLIPSIISGKGESVLFYLMLPLGLLLTAIHNIGTNWSIRQKFFKSISLSKMTNSLFGNGMKVVFGFLHIGYMGLILGTIIGLVVSAFWFVRDFVRARKKYQISARSPRNRVLAKEYSEFPKINLPHVLMDLGRDLLVAVILLEIFSKEDFGLYDHSYRMLRLPLILMGTAIGQVFFQRCAEKINKGEDVVPLMKRSVGTLALLSIVPFAVIFFFGEELFAFVFGEDWKGSGTYSEIMAPWFLVNFIISPISSLPLILRRQRSFFLLAAGGSVLIILSLLLPYLMFDADIVTTLWIHSLLQAVFLMFVIYKVFGYAKEMRAEQLNKTS